MVTVQENNILKNKNLLGGLILSLLASKSKNLKITNFAIFQMSTNHECEINLKYFSRLLFKHCM